MSELNLAHREPSLASAGKPRASAFVLRSLNSLPRSFIARRLSVLVLWQLPGRSLPSSKPILCSSELHRNGERPLSIAGSEDLLSSAASSLLELFKGYTLALSIALVLVSLAVTLPFMRDVLQTLTAIFNPLPAIALLPLAMLWFGLGEASLLFVLVHAVVWPFSLAALAGFEQVPEAQRLVGRNYGLRGPRYILYILLPCRAAFDPFRPQGRLGFCLADADRVRACLWRQLWHRRSRLVHLPQSQRPLDRPRVCRARDRYSHRSLRRIRDLPSDRTPDVERWGMQRPAAR